MESETAAFGYLRERLRTASPAVRGPLAIRDMRREVNGERRSRIPKSRPELLFPDVVTPFERKRKSAERIVPPRDIRSLDPKFGSFCPALEPFQKVPGYSVGPMEEPSP